MTINLSTSSSGSKPDMQLCLDSVTNFSKSISLTTVRFYFILPKRQYFSQAKKDRKPIKLYQTFCSRNKTKWLVV